MPTAPPGPRRPLRRRLLFATILLVLAWGALEIAAVVGFGLAFGAGYSPGRLRTERAALAGDTDALADARGIASATNWCLHPYLGYVLDPEDPSAARADSGSGVSEWGFPDDGPPFRPDAPNTVQIALLGGSVAAMFAADGGEALVRELRAVPGLADQRIELVHLANPGYRQPQQLIAFELALVQGGAFDAAIDISGLNEITRPLQVGASAGIHPLFPSNWRFLAAEALAPAVQRAIGSATFHRALRRDVAEWFDGSVWSYSPLCNVLWKATDRVLEGRQSAALAVARAAGNDGGLRYAVSGPRHDLETEREQITYGADVWARATAMLHEQCRGRGIRSFHFLQPNQYVPGSKPMGHAERAVAWQADHPTRRVVEQGYPLLQERGAELAARGIAFHDLTRVFEAVEEPLYIDPCCHLNARGNELLARAIAIRIAPALAADVAGSNGERADIETVVVDPPRLQLAAPFARGRMRVIGRLGDGSAVDLGYACRDYTSTAPDIVAVDRFGGLTARAGGTATIRCRFGELDLELVVEVALPPVAMLDNEAPRADDPRLVVAVRDGAIEARLDPIPSPGVVGWLVVGTESRGVRYCRERLFVDLQNDEKLPLGAGAERGTWRIPLIEPLAGRTLYLQGALVDERLPCRLRTTDGAAVTVR